MADDVHDAFCKCKVLTTRVLRNLFLIKKVLNCLHVLSSSKAEVILHTLALLKEHTVCTSI